jgi:lysophospholipase L1-like esterase
MRGRPTGPCALIATLLTLLAFFGLRDGHNFGTSEPFVIASAHHLQHHHHARRKQALKGSLRFVPTARDAASSLRWLAIGDSITQAIAPSELRTRAFRRAHPPEGTCSLLAFLRDELSSRCAVESVFVGPFHLAAGGPYNPICPKPSPRHAATWGITADEVSSNRGYKAHFRPLHNSPNGSRRESLTRGSRVYDWVRTHRPHVVSLLLGTNDLSMGSSPHVLLDEYLQPLVLQAIRAAEDTKFVELHDSGGTGHDSASCVVVVVMMTLLPRADEVMSAVSDFNELLERRDKRWLHHPCIEVISISEGLNASNVNLFYDGLHPTNNGSQIIARNVVRELTTAHTEGS